MERSYVRDVARAKKVNPFSMHRVIIGEGQFAVSCPAAVTPGAIECMLDALSRRGILLTSYGNVGSGSESLVSPEEYWQLRNKRACLDTDGIRYVLERVARMVTENGGTWNQEWSSRALRAIFMQGEPAADAAIVGHGEFIAAMLFHGFAAMFTPDTETDCLFKVSPSKRFLQSLK